ncbi:hypothetical protein ACOI1H_16245 [Loktanella sp. DJP18]|uniref:hypothetical protein n=1 Tax=Loktanella sp. DJP18 TaxID=3409788 RepID=UPI003BB7B1C2
MTTSTGRLQQIHRDNIQKSGLRPKDIEDIVSAVSAVHDDEFYVAIDDMTHRLFIYLERDIEEEWLPDHYLDPNATLAECAAWEKSLAHHAVALHDIAEKIADIDDPAARKVRCIFDTSGMNREVRCIFNTSGMNRGALAISLPLSALHLAGRLYHALETAPEAPYSNHAILDVTQRLTWHHDPVHVPAGAIPGPRVALEPIIDAERNTPDPCAK